MVLASERLEDVLNGDVDTLLVTGGDSVLLPTTSPSMRAMLAKDIGASTQAWFDFALATYILAELGVLNGREATTHRQACGLLQRDYPSVCADLGRTPFLSIRTGSGRLLAYPPE